MATFRFPGAVAAGLFFGAGWFFDGFQQGVDFFLFEEAVSATRNAFNEQRTEADAHDFFHGVMFTEEHGAERFEFGTLHRELIPEVGAVAARGFRLANGFQVDAHFPADAIEIGKREHAFDFYMKSLVDVIPVFEKLCGEVTVIGEENQAGGGIFEIADGIDALRKSAKKIAKRFAALRIGQRRDDFRRFVEEEIHMAWSCVRFDETSGGFDFVRGRVSLGAEFGDHFAVYADLAGKNELFGVTPGGDACSGDDFL